MITVLLIILDDRIGGTPKRILNIAKFNKCANIKFLVVIPQDNGIFADILLNEGIEFLSFKMLRLRYKLDLWYFIKWLFNFPISIYKLIKIIINKKVDIVHAFGLTQITGPIAAKICGKKLVWQINDMVTPFATPFLFIAKHLSDVIAVSSNNVHKHYFGNNIKTITLYSAVDCNLFKNGNRNNIRKEFKIQKDTVVIGMVGNVNKYKGHLDFIRAASIIKNKSNRVFKFVIVGYIFDNWITYYKELILETVKLGIDKDIFFAGGRNDIPDVLSSFDIFVHPSLSESFGLSIIEAMAAGKPVVATFVGGIPEIIPNNNFGLLVPPSCPDKLAQAILELVNDSREARRVSANASKRVTEFFGIDNFAKNHQKLYSYLK